ncbi:type II secretion system F family protein [Vibrio breoganii]|uniref:type II secretion system F family protein n=1 Tax=Vibrio breoganii TaxID=553239 RepID=UPI000C8435B4|nr:type II secretion system F family protein [Vibrio breoganii]PML12732.1 hypothetical protein BCT84_02285 [Vibrio breoganii]
MSLIAKLMMSSGQKIDLLADIEDLLKEGTSIVDVANDLVAFGAGAEKDIGQRILDQVGNGKSVAYAFEGYVSDIVVQTLLAGERAEDLAGGCKNAVTAIQNTGGVAGLIASSLGPPIALFLLIFGVVIALAANIFPTLEDMVPMNMWPGFSRNYYLFVSDVADNWMMYMGIAIATPILFISFCRNGTGGIRELLDKVPFFAQYRYVIASQIMFTMSTLLRNGESMVDALRFCETGASRYQKWKVGQIKERMEESRSASIGSLLDIQLLHVRQLNRLRITGSLGGGNDERLFRAAENHTSMLSRQITAFGKTSKILVMACSVLLLLLLIGSIMLLVMTMRSAM